MALSERASSAGFEQERVDAITDPAVLLDERGAMLACNQAFEKIELQRGKGAAILERLGPHAANAHKFSSKGSFNEVPVAAQENRSWLASFVPQPGGQVLVVLVDLGHNFAYIDSMTGLPNRFAAEERLERDLARRQRSGSHKFGLALADIDFFKRVNDVYGHDVGDQVLRYICNVFRGQLRAGDWAARWGGEEFLLYFHDADIDEAMLAATRVREALEKSLFRSSEGLRLAVTVSLGVVSSTEYSAEELYQSGFRQMVSDADILLYDAKHAGRNCSGRRRSGEQLHWSPKQISETLAEQGKIRASGVGVLDANGARRGTLWRPKLMGMGARSARHFFQSAVRGNMLDKAEAAWLRIVGEEDEPSGDDGLAFAVVSHASVQRLAESEDLQKALRGFASGGKRLVLTHKAAGTVAAGERILRPVSADLGVDTCLWITDYETAPTGLLHIQKPSYVLLEEPEEHSEQLFEDLLHMLKEHGTTTILPAAMRSRQIDHPKLLYLDDGAS